MLSTLLFSKLKFLSVLMPACSCVGVWKPWEQRSIFAYSGHHFGVNVRQNILKTTIPDGKVWLQLSDWADFLHGCSHSTSIWCDISVNLQQLSPCYWATLSVILAATTADSCLSLCRAVCTCWQNQVSHIGSMSTTTALSLNLNDDPNCR